MPREVHTFGCNGAPIDPTPLDYRFVAESGHVMARVCCERGHLLTEFLPASGPPVELEPRRWYMAGVAVGYALAENEAVERRAATVRRLMDQLPIGYTKTWIASLMGASVAHLQEMYEARRPKALPDIYRAATRWATGRPAGRVRGRLEIPCPTCFAAPGESCINRAGQEKARMHPRRRE